MSVPAIVVRRGADRPVSAGGGVTSRHGLSFGGHYDADRTSFGALVAHNDDRLAPGTAYGEHTHADVEILTWVLSGAMVHRGPSGREDVVGPGVLQHLAAGTGWRHDERCAGPEPVHLLQLWIAPALEDPPASEPSLAHAPVDPSDGPVVAAGGAGAAVVLRRSGVTLTVARLGAGERWSVPAAGWRHVHVARGAVTTDAGNTTDAGDTADAGDTTDAGDTADAGDTLEATGDGPLHVVAGDEGAEVLVVATQQ